MTEKKKTHAANYAVGGVTIGTGGALAVAGEHDSRIYDKAANRLSPKVTAEGNPAEHTALAEKYDGWSRKSGPNYPYVTHKMREEAARRASEHRAKAGVRANPFTEAQAGRYRQLAHESRMVGRVGGGTLAALGAAAIAGTAVSRHKFDEAKHRRNRGKFASTGVKKNMDEITKDFREELHRRATDGRFQAGAAGAAGAGLAAGNLRGGAKRAGQHREAAKPHQGESARLRHEAAQDENAARTFEERAATASSGRRRKGFNNDAQTLRQSMWTNRSEAYGHELKAKAHLRSASTATRNGRVGAALALGAGAAGAAALLHHHNQNKEIAVEKNLSAEEIFSKARMERSHWAGAKHGAKVGAGIGGGLGALQGAAVGGGMGAAAHGGTGAAVGALAGAGAGGVSGGLQGGAVGGIIGAAVGRNVPKKKAVKKNADPVELLFDAARGDEVSKAIWNDAAEVAGKVGGKVKGGAQTGFNAAKPKVAAAGTGLKTRWAGQSQARKYTAVGAAGAAGGIGLGAAAQGRKRGTNGTNL